MAVGQFRQLPATPAMVLPLPWLSCCCRRLLLPSWPLAPQSSWRCCSQSPKASTKEQTSSTSSGKRSPPRVSGTKSREAEGWRNPFNLIFTGLFQIDTTPNSESLD